MGTEYSLLCLQCAAAWGIAVFDDVCETLQKVSRYTCFVPCVLAKGQWHRMLWLLKCGEEMHSGLQDSFLLDGREKKVAKIVCLASARSVMCCFSCCMVQYPLFSGPENPDLEHMLNLYCVSNLRAGH